MDLFVGGGVLLLMFMHLVLFAVLGDLKMRSPAFRGVGSRTRVEGRLILGQVFYFLFCVESLSPYLALEMLDTQSLGGFWRLQVTDHVKGSGPYSSISDFEHCDLLVSVFCLTAYGEIWNNLN